MVFQAPLEIRVCQGTQEHQEPPAHAPSPQVLQAVQASQAHRGPGERKETPVAKATGRRVCLGAPACPDLLVSPAHPDNLWPTPSTPGRSPEPLVPPA